MIDVLCLGEPLLEFNEQQPGQYVRSIGGDVSNVAVAVARQGGQAGMLTRMGQDSLANSIALREAAQALSLKAREIPDR